MEVVVPCDCGTRFCFEVEPVAGRLPAGAELVCPTCKKDGVPLANRVIGDSLRKRAAEDARLAAAAPPKKKSIFSRSRDKKQEGQPVIEVAHAIPLSADSFADPRGATAKDVCAGPNKVRGMIGAAVGGAAGAAVWATMVFITGYEIRYVAVGVGALVGWCSRKFGGGRDYHLGLFATACALLAILVGQWFAANAFIKKFAAEFAATKYETRLEYAKDVDALKTDADFKQFIAARDSTPFKQIAAVMIKDDVVAAFKKTDLPALKKLAAGEPSRETFIEQEKTEYLQKLGIKDIFIASITPYLFFWVFVGVGAAWKLASDYGTSVE